jgi:hypothetical protein
MPILKPPLTFATPSVVNDIPQARAKVERDYKKIVREAARYLGAKRVKELNKEVAIARRGRTPNESLNERLRAEYDVAAADGPVDIPKFSEEFYKAHRQQSAKAVERRLRRLLKAWEKARDWDRKLKDCQRPSFVGEAGGTK